MVNASAATKQAFQRLLQGESVTRQLDKQISTHDLFMRNDMSMWTLLLMSGYLNSQSVIYARGLYQCELNFPNQEVRDVYYTVIQQWLSAGSALTIHTNVLKVGIAFCGKVFQLAHSG